MLSTSDLSPMAAAVFASMLRAPLKRRCSPSSGIHPDNAAELMAALEELERAGEVWRRSRRRNGNAVGTVTEIRPELTADMEITTDRASELLGCTTSRIRQLLRAGVLPGRQVGRCWLVRRADVVAFARGRAAA